MKNKLSKKRQLAISSAIALILLSSMMIVMQSNTSVLFKIDPIEMQSSLRTYQTNGEISFMQQNQDTLGVEHFAASMNIRYYGLAIHNIEITITFFYDTFEVERQIQIDRLKFNEKRELKIENLPGHSQNDNQGIDWRDSFASIKITGVTHTSVFDQEYTVELLPKVTELTNEVMIDSVMQQREEDLVKIQSGEFENRIFTADVLSLSSGINTGKFEITSAVVRRPISPYPTLQSGVDLYKGYGPQLYFNLQIKSSDVPIVYIGIGINAQKHADHAPSNVWPKSTKLTSYSPRAFGDSVFKANKLYSFVYNLPWGGLDMNNRVYAFSKTTWTIPHIIISQDSSYSSSVDHVFYNVWNNGQFNVADRYTTKNTVLRLGIYDQTISWKSISITNVFNTADSRFDAGGADYPDMIDLKSLLVYKNWADAKYETGYYRVDQSNDQFDDLTRNEAQSFLGSNHGKWYAAATRQTYEYNMGFDTLYAITVAYNKRDDANGGHCDKNYAWSVGNSMAYPGPVYLNLANLHAMVQHESSHYWYILDVHGDPIGGDLGVTNANDFAYSPNSFWKGVTVWKSPQLDVFDDNGLSYYDNFQQM